MREERTARLTILIDPRKKAVFESLCAAEDVTPSQALRALIRGYIEERLGEPWSPATSPAPEAAVARAAKHASAKRRAASRPRQG